MSWLAGHSWIWWVLSALLGFAVTWWWMVRTVRGRVPVERVIERSSGAVANAGMPAATASAPLASAPVAPAAPAPTAPVAPAPAPTAPVAPAPTAPVAPAPTAPVAPAPTAPVAVVPVAGEPVTPSVDAAEGEPVDERADEPLVDAEPAVAEPAAAVAAEAQPAAEVEASEAPVAADVEPVEGTEDVEGAADQAGDAGHDAAGGAGAVAATAAGAGLAGAVVDHDADTSAVAAPVAGAADEGAADAAPAGEAVTGTDEVSDAGAGGDAEAAATVAATLAAPVAAAYAVGKFGAGSVDPLSDGSMPEGYPVKGNEDSMLYHSPQSPWYGRTKAEVWFADEATAAAAGFARWDSRVRSAGAGAGADGEAAASGAASLAAPAYAVGKFGAGSVDPLSDGSLPEGYPVKGNEDSMLYHSPQSPWYGRTKAEVWFADEATAAAAGFARWDSRARSAGAGAGAGADGGGAATGAASLAAPAYAVGKFGAGSVDPLSDGSMPEGYPVKGNEDSMLYHSPQSPWYGRTKAEVWFADEATAAAAGFARWDSRARSAGAGAGADGEAAASGAASLAAPAYAVGKFGAGSVDPLTDGSMPEGYPVKGNEDSMLYHSPQSPWYGRTKAEVWFADEATAAAAGFSHWDPAKR